HDPDGPEHLDRRLPADGLGRQPVPHPLAVGGRTRPAAAHADRLRLRGGARRGGVGGAARHLHRSGGARHRRGPGGGRGGRGRLPPAGHGGGRLLRRHGGGGRHAVGAVLHAGAGRAVRVDRHRVRGGDPGRDRPGAGDAGRRCAGGRADQPGVTAVGEPRVADRRLRRDHPDAAGPAARPVRHQGGEVTARMVRPLVGFPLVLLGLAALALFDTELGVTTFYLTLLATMFFWVAQSTSWNILSGYSGYFSFGQDRKSVVEGSG